VFYGWFDNHLAYISTAVKFLDDKGINGKEFWNSADIYHFIGKDIVYHHYLFLPAMRLGINSEYKLPDFIPTRGHLTLQSKKISKSRNWYIGLRQFLEYYPADYLRYYLIAINPYSQDDLNFDWDEFTNRINSELIGNLGNFVNRALGFTKKAFDGVIPETENYDQKDIEAESKIKNLSGELGILMEQNHLDRALKKIMEFSSFFNQYFQHKEPWKKGPGTANCVFLSVNAARSMAIALFPFLPEASQKIWEQLGFTGKVNDNKWDSISDVSVKSGHLLGDATPLFAKIEESDIAKYKKQLGPSA
jgi:methionyl-tRNA synthetase